MRARPLVPVMLVSLVFACASNREPVAPNAGIDVAAASDASLSTAPGCKSIAGTFYGKLDRSRRPAAWVGPVLVSLAGGPTERASFVTINNEIDVDRLLQGKSFTGRETATLTFSAGSFEVVADFVGLPGSTPGFYQLRERGQIQNGTGGFAGASGHVAIDGPFMSPVTEQAPLFIGQMHGSLCGIG